MLAILKGASPAAPHDRALRHSAREAAAAKAEIGATQALFGLYGPAARHDAARAAAELAAGLGVPLRAAGPASTGSGYPPWRFGMAQNPYLAGPSLGGSRTDRFASVGETAAWPPRGRGSGGDSVPPSITRLRQGNTRAFNPLLNLAQWYQAFGFDPAGPSVPSVALGSPEYAAWARWYASRARSNAKKNFPNLPRADSARDAFRHAYWNLRMARTLGPETAQRFADSREIGSTNTAGSRLMDLWNNFVGRRLAANTALADRLPTDVVLDAMERRALQTQPFTVRNGIPSP